MKKRPINLQFRGLILASWFLCGLLLAQNTAEEQVIDQLSALELKKYQNEDEAFKGLRETFNTIDREKLPRAWLYGFSLLGDHESAEGLAKIDSAIQQAADWQDLTLQLRFIIQKVVALKSQNAPEAEIRKGFTQGEKLCPEDSRNVWCGRLYDFWAFFYYDTNDDALALKQAKKAITILERAEGREVFFLHNAQTTLAKIFSSIGEWKQAYKLTVDNQAWYEQNEYYSLAGTEANNITMYLSKGQQDYKQSSITKEQREFEQEIFHWLDKAEKLAEKAGGNNIMFIVYSRARFLYKSGRYTEALKAAEQGIKMFTEDNSHDFTALCEVLKARALTQLNRINEATAALDRAFKLVPESYGYEHTAIREARIEVAEADKKFDQAFQLLRIHHKKWKEQKEEDTKRGMNRLNAELGLKLEEERNEKLSKENELQKDKIREAETIRIFVIILGILSMSTFGFLLFALRQTRQVKMSRGKMQRILDHIDEGLLTFDRSRKISDDYSKRLPEILGSTNALVGQDIMAVIFNPSHLSGEEQSIIHEVLEATFQEDRLAWDLNAENLVRELRFDKEKEQLIELRWIPIFDEQDKLERLLLSLTDITEKKALEKAFGQQKRYLQALPDTLKEMLMGQPQHIARLLEATQDVLEKMQNNPVDAPLLRNLHTQKGTARALGLRALSQDLHDLETILHPKTGQSMGHNLDDQLKGIQDRLLEYRAIAEVLKNTQRADATIRSSLAHTLQAHIPSWLDQMQKGGQELHKLSIIDGVLHWRSEQLQILEQVCVHAINNSIDHGFLEADTPIKRPEIEIAVEHKSGWMLLEIRDNGQGLNLDQLSRLAAARGFVPKGTESIADVVFSDGVSLAKRLSISSGRGVGLAAVKELIESKGGEVRLLNRTPIQGSVLRASWPSP